MPKNSLPRRTTDLDKLTDAQRKEKAASKANADGLKGGKLIEPDPKHNRLECEEVIKGQNNTWIILGRDRPGGAGKGKYNASTAAGAIDICVGKGGVLADSNKYFDPNFRTDAARIYISQKTDVDDNFGIVDGKIGNIKTRSAIGIKADAVRIVSRDAGIKLVTRTDSKNSQDADAPGLYGIEFLAGNDQEKLQPLVKGKSLESALKEIIENINSLNGIVDHLLSTQSHLNKAIVHHKHLEKGKVMFAGPFPVYETLQSLPVTSAGMKCALDTLSQTKTSISVQKINLANFNKYLTPGDDKYILSRHVRTT